MAQEVEVKIKVDTSKAVSDMNTLGSAFDTTAQDAMQAEKAFHKAGAGVQVEQSIAGLKQLKRELKNTAVGSDEFKKIFNDIDDLEDKLKSAKNTSADFVDSLANSKGPLGMLGQGLNQVKVATQSFGGALKATGIGLVVALIGGLVAAFSENEGAMKKLQPVMDGLKKAFQGVFRAIEPVFNSLVDIAAEALPYVTKGIGMVYSSLMGFFTLLKESGGGAMKILEGIFTMDSKKITAGIDQVSGSFAKTATSYTESMKRFESGSKELTEKEKEEAEKREQNRKDALEKKHANEEKAKEKAIQKAKAEADALQKIKDEANKEAIRQAESYREQLEGVQKTEADAKKANADALLSATELAIQKENEDFEAKKARAILYGSSFAEIEKQHLNEIGNIISLASITQNEKDQADADAVIAFEQAKRDAKVRFATDTFTSLANITDVFLGKSKAGIAIQKGIAIAQIGIDTASAFSKAVPMAIQAGKDAAEVAGPASPIVGPIATAISYASSAAMIASNVMKAKSVLSGGSASAGGGGSAPPSGGITAPQTANFNVVGASGTNQIAQTIAGQQQQPIQAFVVAGAVTTAQSLNRNIIESASIG